MLHRNFCHNISFSNILLRIKGVSLIQYFSQYDNWFLNPRLINIYIGYCSVFSFYIVVDFIILLLGLGYFTLIYISCIMSCKPD